MAGQAAEQIIAGVVLSERLAVTMYGAIHRAQFGGQRNLRGLVVDPKLLEDAAFRGALTDARSTAAVTRLEHPNIVSTVTVEAGGPDVVVVTRGGGRYVTVQDLIAAAKAKTKQGGRLSMPIALAIGKSVIDALAAAHRVGLTHGAVHPRSVVIEEDGGVRLGDFIVGRALTTAVAQGADSSLWRGLSGFVAPELVVGEDPTPGVDVFAVGALLFTMLSGEVPPGSLRATPAVERLVQRALDTDTSRRYRTANDLLENLLEAMEDDRWELADRGELIKEAGLSATDENIDDATEDLLASLGKAPHQITTSRPTTPDVTKPPKPAKRLDSLLSELGDETGLTQVDPVAPGRDPVSDVIRGRRVPSLDDPDDESIRPIAGTRAGLGPAELRAPAGNKRADEAAALAALDDLDDEPRRAPSESPGFAEARSDAQRRGESIERSSRRSPSEKPRAASEPPAPRKVARPIVDPIQDLEVPPPRIKSRIPGLIALAVVIAGGVGFYFVYKDQQAKNVEASEKKKKELADKEALEAKLRDELPDPGAIKVRSNPPEAGVWLKLGRTPLDSLPLSSGQLHEIRLEGVAGHHPIDTQVMPIHWSGEKEKRRGSLNVPLKAIGKKQQPAKLPAMPAKPPEAFGFAPGRGPLHIESTPPGAEVWLYLGMTNQVDLSNIQAGAAYELRVLKDGFLPGYVTITPDEWREDGADKNIPINVAKKKAVLERSVDLAPDPEAKGK